MRKYLVKFNSKNKNFIAYLEEKQLNLPYFVNVKWNDEKYEGGYYIEQAQIDEFIDITDEKSIDSVSIISFVKKHGSLTFCKQE